MKYMKYTFTSELWVYSGQGAWHFITLPSDISAEIKQNFDIGQPGFGSIRVAATIGDYSWNTSIFPDSKLSAYVTPIKAEARKKAGVSDGDKVNISIELLI